MGHHLNDEQLAQYHEQGYLDCGRVLSDETLAELHALTDRLVAATKTSNVQLSPNDQQSYTNFTPVFTQEPSYETLVNRHPALLDIIESILGPVFRLVEDQLFYKPARHGGPLAYHHDNIYYGFEDPKIVTCWIALDDATPENGCLRVLPGSHRQKIEHTAEPGALPSAVIDEAKLIDVPAASGTLIIFDGLLVHGSGPNTTDHVRRAANMVAIVPTADGTTRKFDDVMNPYLRGEATRAG